MEIIRCEGLSKIYQAGENKVFALDNVDLTIEQGSFTAITGPSGSGKSTLLHLLSGLDTPSKGRVIYQGKNLYDYKDNQLSVLRRRRFGFVFQSYNLVRELTGWENILLPVMLDGRKADEAYLDQIVDMLASATVCPICLVLCPVVSSSAYPSPAHWQTSLRFCLLTNPPAIWMVSPDVRC